MYHCRNAWPANQSESRSLRQQAVSVLQAVEAAVGGGPAPR